MAETRNSIYRRDKMSLFPDTKIEKGMPDLGRDGGDTSYNLIQEKT